MLNCTAKRLQEVRPNTLLIGVDIGKKQHACVVMDLRARVATRFKFSNSRQHFETLNHQQSEITYFFHFLSPRDYDTFFKFLREGTYESFVSSLDAALERNADNVAQSRNPRME